MPGSLSSERIVFSEKILNVINTVFYNCSSENGGGILSDIDAFQRIKHCTFINCSAINHGGACIFYKGNVKILSCSTIGCTGGVCPDIVCWTPKNVKCSHVQCYKSYSDRHLMYLSANENLIISNINCTTCTSVYTEFYGGLTIANGYTMIDTKYISIVDCKSAGIISIEYINNREIEIHNLEALNNSNEMGLIDILYCNNPTVMFFNSLFIGNKISNYYSLPQSTLNSIVFSDSVFSFNQQSTNSLTTNNCSFAVSNINTLRNFIPIFYNDDKTYVVRKSNYAFCFISLLTLLIN